MPTTDNIHTRTNNIIWNFELTIRKLLIATKYLWYKRRLKSWVRFKLTAFSPTTMEQTILGLILVRNEFNVKSTILKVSQDFPQPKAEIFLFNWYSNGDSILFYAIKIYSLRVQSNKKPDGSVGSSNVTWHRENTTLRLFSETNVF